MHTVRKARFMSVVPPSLQNLIQLYEQKQYLEANDVINALKVKVE